MPSPTQARGSAQEDLAERILLGLGYHVVERNWRGAGAEIDRIAWDGPILCFVEVRSRMNSSGGSPEASISPRKRRHLIRGARAYLTRFPPEALPMARFDVVALENGPRGVRHRVLQNAFDADGRP